MAKVVDARGLSCPQPALLARRAIEEGELPIEVLVDTGTSRDNVSRIAQKAGYKVRVEEKEGWFVVKIEK